MPLYDYRCDDCHRVTSLLTYSWSEAAAPVCHRCHGSNL
ncbi:MAG: zinc ribbon domain-containing protein, partial [Planctomycetes bacterium]|nr:zinc ribbon domain-containing protein [Planctomycetota bacterium]